MPHANCVSPFGIQGQHNQPVDESHVQNAHDQAYNQGNGSSLGASSMGAAAAMQVCQKAMP